MVRNVILAFLGIMLFASVVCAQEQITLVTGKVYNSDFSETESGASVTVTCNSFSETTNSISDGSYAVTFSASECPEDKIVKVTAKSSSLQGSDTGKVLSCAGVCDADFVAVANPSLTDPIIAPQSDDDFKSEYSCVTNYRCTEWSECSGGYQTRSCQKERLNCVVEDDSPLELRECLTESEQSESTSEQDNEDDDSLPQEVQVNEEESSSSGITGAAIGSGGRLNWALLAILLGSLILIIALIKVFKKPSSPAVTSSFY